MATYSGIKKIKIGDNIFNLYDSGNSGGTITSVKTTAGAHTTINVTSGAANFNVPTKTSHLTNDSGFLTSHQTAVTSLTTTSGSHSTISNKTGAVSIAIPTKTSQLTNDSGYITNAGVTSITTSAGSHSTKSSATGAVSFNVPTKTSHLTNDSGFITVNSTFTGATASAAGTKGTVPAPAAGDTQKIIFGDAIWWDIGLTSYYNLDGDVQIQLYRSRSASGGAGVTTESLGLVTLIPAATDYAGLMSAADKTKLDGVGTYIGVQGTAAVSVPNNTAKAVCSVSVGPGTWLIIAYFRAPVNGTGYRMANISTVANESACHFAMPACTAQVTQGSFSRVVGTTAASTTYYLNVYQNSGSTLSYPVGWTNYLQAVRISG